MQRIAAFVLLVSLLPLILVLILLSRISYKESGLFKQERIGLKGVSFTLFKIRSMDVKKNKIGKFGSFIRRYKLDEIPQLINILKGDMSFVGPRPELPEYYVLHSKYPKKILEVKPGLTGLATLYFFNEDKLLQEFSVDAKFENWMYQRKVTLNSIYVNHQSFCFNLEIILKSIYKVLKQ